MELVEAEAGPDDLYDVGTLEARIRNGRKVDRSGDTEIRREDRSGGGFALGVRTSGSPTDVDLSDLFPYRGLPDASTAVLGAQFQVPNHWLTCKASTVWFNTSSTSGNVVFRGDRGAFGSGDTLTRTVGSNVTVAAPSTANVVAVSEMFTGEAVTAGERLALSVGRVGGDAADTLTNTIGVLGVLVERVT